MQERCGSGGDSIATRAHVAFGEAQGLHGQTRGIRRRIGGEGILPCPAGLGDLIQYAGGRCHQQAGGICGVAAIEAVDLLAGLLGTRERTPGGMGNIAGAQ